jgi:hypothetical protein
VASLKIVLVRVWFPPVEFTRARQFIEAVAAHDFEAAETLLDPDVETVTPRDTFRQVDVPIREGRHSSETAVSKGGPSGGADVLPAGVVWRRSASRSASVDRSAKECANELACISGDGQSRVQRKAEAADPR